MSRKKLLSFIPIIFILLLFVIFSNQCVAQFPLVIANQVGTWVGQWYIPNTGVTGKMTLDIVQDPVTGAASAFAVLELNAFLGAGISLNGTISNNVAILQGSVLTPFGPKPLTVNMTCTLYSPTLLTGSYQIADYQGGSVKVYEVGLFELGILPSLLTFTDVIIPPIAPPVVIPPPVPTVAALPATTPVVTPIAAAPAPTAALVAPIVTAPVPAPTIVAPAPTIAAPAPTIVAPAPTVAAPTAVVSALVPFVPFLPPPLPLIVAEETGTWVGQWLVPASGATGNMVLDIVEDPLTGAASAFALLELNPLLQAGVSLSGTVSNNIVILGGSISTIVGPKPVRVDMICTLDSPIHMTGTYRVSDVQGGSVKIFEEGIFDLSLLPPLLIP
ncbi:MAG: hypothetical protein ACMUIP_05235 [bacterium]